jgi:hypothetical protein
VASLLLSLSSLAVPAVTVFAFLAAFLPLPLRSFPSFLLLASLSTGIGFGCASVVYFLWLASVGPPGPAFFVLEAAALILALALLHAARRRRPAEGWEHPSPETGSGRLAALCVLAVLLGAASLVVLSLENPQGGFDASAIWNVKARFLFRGAGHWQDAFSPLLRSHPDYPLLLPALVTRSWSFLGRETTLVPSLISSLFTLSTVGLLISSLALMKGKRAASLAGIVLAGTPFFIKQGSLQYADIPLSFFILAALVFLCLSGTSSGGGRRAAVAAGLAAGLAAWTKNEGILVLLAILAAFFLGTLAVKNRRAAGGDLLALLAGAAPILALLAWFKLTAAPPTDLFSLRSEEDIASKLGDPSRYLLIGQVLLTKLVLFGNGLALLTVLALTFCGFDVKKVHRRTLMAGSLALGIVLAGHFYVYVITPWGLGWHLRTSLERLLLQLWPAALFLVFMAIRPPGEGPARGADG